MATTALASVRPAAPTAGAVMPPATTTGTTTYRPNLHTPRKPSPLNPAAQKPIADAQESTERQGRDGEHASQGGARRARTVSPVQKILRRKAAKTLQTNTLRRQVEAYEAKALQNLSTKAAPTTTATRKGKGKEASSSTVRVGISVTSAKTKKQGSRKKRRRRWGAVWMFLSTRPVVAALGNLWPFGSRTTPELAWHPGESQTAVAAAA